MTHETDIREIEWPEPREDPPEEPSHPGARHEDPNEHGPDKKIDPKS